MLEIDIEAKLARRFPQDAFVREIKNTRHWQPARIDKLKADQRASGANKPRRVRPHHARRRVGGRPARVAVALREQLIEIASLMPPPKAKSEKMERLYHYLAGDQFRRRIEATVEAFTALRNGLTRERNAMERIWNEREKQIDAIAGGSKS